MLEIQGIETFYGETQALFGVDLSVGKGEAVALLGPNGAGKTTVLRSILGLTPARRGAIRFGGSEITRAATSDIACAGIGWVPDDRRIFPALKVRTNLQLGKKKTAFRSWSEKEVFGLFPALEYLLDRDSENLSGGEMQMVAIGRALLGGPGLVLLDEPSQGLAPKLVQDVMKTIARLRDEGIGVLVVEQNVRSALAVCDRAYVIRGGRVVHHGPAKALLEDARLLGELS
ncbi:MULTISPECIES: ABC transporter ATP-binding protein [Sorangium]|uniref:Amino acid ABC transporter ATPase n=1 Tax=Sorangium cellulosum TaxID=56 RepID=A0A4P2QSH8_SORCE|nr:MULTISPECIES: ABC transporter ATP-binding protein [Sorangium]AUX32996.1 amino acid ABC transporter ATPase [Sorangium cellulosum]WCQ92372.1 High-affinity branched-chain amino acid transport ATP-binding protein LivF [Sorangium sp. Soce836]